MILIIPIGGFGEEFKNARYFYPKPLIPVLGKPMIEWLLDNIDLKQFSHICIPYIQELGNYQFEEMLKNKYSYISFLFYPITFSTRGPLDTIYYALQQLNNSNHLTNSNKIIGDSPILSLDVDCFYQINIVNLWKKNNFSVFVFEDYSNDPIYSYVIYDSKNKKITNIAEKEKISNYACTGAYGFPSWKDLLNNIKDFVETKNSSNKFYLSSFIKQRISYEDYSIISIEPIDYVCLGTPLQIRIFTQQFGKMFQLKMQHKLESKRFCFDLDNTLVTFPKIKNDYSTVEPIEKNIKVLRNLKKMGHTIIIHTARRMKTHNGNVAKIIADIGKITIDTLERLNIPYDELLFGKPYADYYIDDKAVNAFDNLEKELGFYQDNIETRDFHSIVNNHINTLYKHGQDLSGEIHYYLNIPDLLRENFPKFIDYDIHHKYYQMEKVEGIPISKLYLSGDLSIEQFQKIIDILAIMHSYQIQENSKEINIYLNYADKLKQRFINYDYSIFDGYQSVYDKLIKFLEIYESKKQGITTIIHGDPVFTNILITHSSKIKLIDMRGKLGNQKTIYGDCMYDWAKIYQSLMGYDEILENTVLEATYKKKILNHFTKFIIERYGIELFKNIQILTASLFFTLIPLHNNEKCIFYFESAKHILNNIH